MQSTNTFRKRKSKKIKRKVARLVKQTKVLMEEDKVTITIKTIYDN